MPLPEFEFHEPATVNEACRIMGELGEKTKLFAGGTDLLVNMKKKLLAPDHLVSLGRIQSLTQLDASNGSFRIGPCVKAAEIAESDAVKSHFPALHDGASRLGSPLIRNLATVGGNLVSARPASDLPPSLMAYGAKATLTNTSGERCIDLDKFFVGPGETIMAPDEILTQVIIEVPRGLHRASYIKLGVRQTLEISLVNVAVFMSLGGEKGPIKTARVVLGSVGPTPFLAESANQVLKGQWPSNTIFARAGEAAAQDCKPIDDFRGSAEYRRDMVRVLTVRALNAALNRATLRE